MLCSATAYRSLRTPHVLSLFARMQLKHPIACSLSAYCINYMPSPSSFRHLYYPTYAAPSSSFSLPGRATWTPDGPYASGSSSYYFSTSAACGLTRSMAQTKDGPSCWILLAQVRLSRYLARLERNNRNSLRLGFTPTKLYLLTLDLIIIFLNMLLTTIAYETSLQSAMPSGTPDPLLPIPPQSPPASPLLSNENNDKSESLSTRPPYVLDLHLSHMIYRLRSAAPPPPERELPTESLLPLPNTTPWQLTNTLRFLMRTRARTRQRPRADSETRRGQDGDAAEARDRRTIPGGLDAT